MERSDFLKAIEQVNILDFVNYCEYLEALFRQLKSSGEPYSYYQFSQDLNLSHSNVMWLIVTRRRRLTQASFTKVAKALSLSGIKRRYFLAMMRQNNSRKTDQQEKYLNEMTRLKEEFLQSDESALRLSYLGQWYHPVIRELMRREDFESNPKWIASQLYAKLLPREIASSLELLEELKLAKYSHRHGKHLQTNEQVKITKDIRPIGLAQFHQKMLEVAGDALTQIPARRREFNALTVCLSQEGLDKVKALLLHTCESIMKIESECLQAEQVYQINLHLFPFTKESKGTP